MFRMLWLAEAYSYNQGRFQFDAGCLHLVPAGTLHCLPDRSEADIRTPNDKHAHPAVGSLQGGPKTHPLAQRF